MKRILIVDDEIGNLNLMYNCLLSKFSNISYTLTTSSEEAFEFIKSLAFDLVITDMLMINIDGYQLAFHLSYMQPDTKIIIVSGYSDFCGRNKKDITINKFLQKPLNIYELQNTVKELLNI